MSPRIGEPLKRLEDERLLRGRGRFLESLRLDGMAEAVLVRSPVAHARITGIDVSAAVAIPGVLAVLTGDDLISAGVQPIPCRVPIASSDGTPFREPSRPVLAHDTVRFVGEAVAIVVAETLAAARDAADLVDVGYDLLPAAVDPARSQETAFVWTHGDAAATEAAFASAAFVSRMTVVNNRVAPAPIEPRSAIGSHDPATGRFTLITQTQGVHTVRNVVARALGVEPAALRVQTPDVGGSFGLKLVPHPELVAVLAAARRVGRPVRWVSTRTEAFLADNYARDHISTGELALDRDGNFLAIRAATRGNLGAYASASAAAVMSIHFARTLGHVYRVPVHHLTVTGIYTHTTPTDVMRGAGKPEATTLTERLIERAAREHGFDRVELRRRNLIRPADLPRKTLSGHTIDGGDFPRVLDRVLALADWTGFAARRRDSAARGMRRGIGLAHYMHVTSHPVEEHCRVWLEADGRVHAAMGAQGIGQGHETTFAQLVAAELGLTLEQVVVVQGDTDQLPPVGAATGGSGSLQATGLPLIRAARVMRNRLRDLAARELEAAAADVEMAEGTFRVVGTDRAMSLQLLARRLTPEERDGCAGLDIYKGDPATCPNGAYVAEVEVDPGTGETHLLRLSGADDVGRRLNPLIVEGQMHGALAQGIGQALCERVVHDPETGQLLTGSLMDYALPLATDLPLFDLAEADVASTGNELGMKGAGECGTIGAPAAVMNAIADAVGHDRIEMPATSERVWRALNDKKDAGR